MAQTTSTTAGKKLIKIDGTADSVCPWCYVGKKNLDKALALSNDQYDFEINWHPFLLNPSALKEGVNKIDYYRSKFGSRADQMSVQMSEFFKGGSVEYSMAGLTIGMEIYFLPFYNQAQLHWKYYDIHEKKFDKFMAIPPCAKGWDDADATSQELHTKIRLSSQTMLWDRSL